MCARKQMGGKFRAESVSMASFSTVAGKNNERMKATTKVIMLMKTSFKVTTAMDFCKHGKSREFLLKEHVHLTWN